MTRPDAMKRAIAVWGGQVETLTEWPTGSGHWEVYLKREASVHGLDSRGRVTCHHDTCRLAEGRVDRVLRGELS